MASSCAASNCRWPRRVIIAGVRTATVLVVGTAVLVTPVGGRSLGNYIFSGMESLNYAETLFGCILGALLAVVLDQLIHLLETAARQRSRARAWVAVVGLARCGRGQPLAIRPSAFWTRG